MDDSDVAELWWMRQGNKIPLRGTPEWTAMFEAWRAHTLTSDF